MKNHTSKAVSLILSLLVLLTALTGCNTDSNITDKENTAENTSQAVENIENTETTEPEIESTQESPQTTEEKSQPQSRKMVIFDKEYDDVMEFFRDEGGNLEIITFQIAKYFLQGDKESLKQYYEKEEDWVYDMEYIFDTDHFSELYYFRFDDRFILTGTDDQGRKTISISFNYIYGGYYNEDGEYIPNTDTYQYVYVNMVYTDEGEWLATGVATGV